MRALVAALVLAACGRGEPTADVKPAPAVDAPPVGEITLPLPAPRAGEVISLDAEVSVSAKVKLYKKGGFGGFLSLSVSHKRVTRAEILSGGRVRVVYDRARMTDVKTGAEQTLPVEGKVYVFDANGVTGADGGAVPEEEDAIVRRDAHAVIAASALPALAASRPLALGRQEDAPADALARLSAPGQKTTRMAWLYKGRRGKAAVLGWTGAVEEQWPNGLVLEANLVGEVLVDPATGVAIEATSDGPVTVEVPVKDGSKVAVYRGNGRMMSRVVRR